MAGTMDLNGYKLTVMGNLTQRGGNLDVNEGNLRVYGNYILGNPDTDGNYQNNRAVLHMDAKTDYMCVEGDVVLAPGLSLSSYLTAGTLELKGNLTYNSINCNFHTLNSNFIVLMSGGEKQTICNTIDGDYFKLGTLDIQNTSAEGVTVTSYLLITSPVLGSENLHGMAGKTLCWNNGEVPQFDNWEGNLNICTATALEKDLNVEGTLIVGNTLDVNGHHLTAASIVLNKSLNINGGIVQVKNNLDFKSQSNSNPCIIMQNESDILQITGNLTATCGTLTLTAGQMDIKGNVNLDGASITVGDSNTVTLSGKTTSKGTAYVQTVTIPENVTLNTLVLTKPREYYVFNRDVEGMCKELVEDIQDIVAPSVPEGLTAVDIGFTKLKLTWQASLDDTGVAGYDIYRNEKKIMSVTGTSYTDTNLEPGTEYSYYVIAKDATLNTSGASKSLTVTTLEDAEAPEIPETPELMERMGTALKLTWQEAADNVKTAGYRIYRDGVEIGTTTRTWYLDTGLLANTHYTYTISAYDDKGNESEQSEEGSFYTQAVEVAGIVPASYTKLISGSPSIQVSFANAGSSAGYQVYMGYRECGTGEGEESYQQLYSKTVGTGTAYRKQITAETTLNTADIQSEEIEVLVRITDAGGYETEEVFTYYLDKSAPEKLSEVGGEVKDGVAVISYAKGTEADIAGYYIYRQTGEQEREKLAEITDVDKTYYYDRTMEEGVTYSYYVAAYDEEGQPGELSDAVVLTGNPDESAPIIEGVEPIDGILSKTASITIQASDNKALDKVIIE
ncbi:MAG: fibronectin type III domain-containing protein, partial [Lachnospiraceae bacterium]